MGAPGLGLARHARVRVIATVALLFACTPSGDTSQADHQAAILDVTDLSQTRTETLADEVYARAAAESAVLGRIREEIIARSTAPSELDALFTDAELADMHRALEGAPVDLRPFGTTSRTHRAGLLTWPLDALAQCMDPDQHDHCAGEIARTRRARWSQAFIPGGSLLRWKLVRELDDEQRRLRDVAVALGADRNVVMSDLVLPRRPRSAGSLESRDAVIDDVRSRGSEDAEILAAWLEASSDASPPVAEELARLAKQDPGEVLRWIDAAEQLGDRLQSP
jgi:hypothetical protein